MIDIVNDPIGAPPTPDTIVHPNVVVLLDESGSMQAFRSEVVSTFNEYVAQVRKTAKSISLYTFDSTGIREKLFKEHPDRVRQLTENDYNPGQMTPLYDAMGVVMGKFYHETRPVHFVVHTDGQENSSAEWTKASLDEYIASLTNKHNNGWLFTYLMEGLGGREALKSFAGLKYGMSNASRGVAMGAVASATMNYAATLDNNAISYTISGTDTDDLDELNKGQTDRALKKMGGQTVTTSGGTS